MRKDQQPAFLDWMALLLLALVWGSSFILIKKALVSFSSMEVGALRISISFLVLWPFLFGRLRKVPPRSLVYFLLAGIIGNGLPPFLFAQAQTVIDSYMAGVLNSLTPLFTLLVGVALFGTRVRRLNVLGVLIGLTGAVGLLFAVNDPALGNGIVYGLYAIGGALCYAFNMNLIKRYLGGFDALTITSVSFLFIGIPALVFLAAGTDFSFVMRTDPLAWQSLGYITILAIVGTALAMIINYWLIRRTTALFAATVTYMMPMVSIFWGIADGELFMLFYLFWIALILLGVYLANRFPAKGRKRTSSGKSRKKTPLAWGSKRN